MRAWPMDFDAATQKFRRSEDVRKQGCQVTVRIKEIPRHTRRFDVRRAP